MKIYKYRFVREFANHAIRELQEDIFISDETRAENIKAINSAVSDFYNGRTTEKQAMSIIMGRYY